MTPPTVSQLKEGYAALREAEPHLFARDAAARLGVSEAELVATGATGSVTRLAPPLAPLLGELGALGEVKTMTRNGWAVIERWGTYGALELDAHVGQVVGEDIDLRVFPRHFASGFAVYERSPKGLRWSLQLFDAHGDSVHKVYLEDATRLEAFAALVARRASGDQGPGQRVEPRPAAAPPKPDAEVDVEALRAAWDAMRDTHELFGILRRFGVTRTQALALAGPERATPVEPAASLEAALRRASDLGLSVMLFVPSRGVIQIHTGALKQVRCADDWINVLDRRVNLHVRRSGLAAGWIARKPTSDGIVTSLELYDADGETVLFMFGARKPGQVEQQPWREITAGLPRAGAL